MCDGGLTMAMMAMSAAQGVAQVKAQKQQAKAQAAAQSAASVREMQRQQMSMRSERMQQGDEETTIAQEQLKANREAEEAISTTTVAGEAAGVSGISAGLSIQDFERKNAEYQGALANQTRMNASARRLSMANSGQQYVGNMANINQAIAQPDYLGTALGTAQNMAGAYQSGQLSKQATANANLTRTYQQGQIDLGSINKKVAQQRLNNLGIQATQSRAQTATSISQKRYTDALRLQIGN